MKLTLFDIPAILVATSVPIVAIIITIQVYNTSYIAGVSLSAGIVIGAALALYLRFVYSGFVQRVNE